MPRFTPWEIILAWIPNADGTPPPYPHYCIYLGESPRSPGRILVLGITSDMSTRIDGYSAELSWAPGGHPETGLARPSLAHAHWTDHIMPDEVRAVVGFTPKREQLAVARCLAKRIADDKRRS